MTVSGGAGPNNSSETASDAVVVTVGPSPRWRRIVWWLPSKAWRDGGWRWRVAELMNQLPGQCWADLVTWAMESNRDAIERADGWRGALPNQSNRLCGPPSESCVCYCGKVRDAETNARMRASGAGRGVVR